MGKQKILAMALAAFVSFGFMYDGEAATREEISQITVKRAKDFQYWNKDAESFKTLTAYIKNITDKKSGDYIPPEDRIAVFDMDGTFICETAPYYFDHMLFLERALRDPSYKPSWSDEKFAQDLDHWLKDKSSGESLESSAPHQASVFEGMTFPMYKAYVNRFMQTPVEGISNLKWGEAFYLPMVEVIKFLQENKFQVYVVSGTERELVRILVSDLLKIPTNNVIGTDIEILASGQGNTDGLKYTYGKNDQLVRGKFRIKNLQMNKTAAIAREIGKQPVLAFGNSSGDASMLNYTINNNKYKSAAFFLLCDDLEREFGDTKKANKCRDLADKNGWTPVSMKNDFKTIYGKRSALDRSGRTL